MTLEEALASIENDGIRLGAGDYVSVEALKVAADVLRKAINGNPVIPGCDDQYNIAEMAYNNGYAKGYEDGKVVSRKGHWIIHSVGHGDNATNWVECSECHVCGSPWWEVCPVCEAKMEVSSG